MVFSRRHAAVGYGGFDVYLSLRRANGEWAQAVNAGPRINGPGGKICPVISADGKVLIVLKQGLPQWILIEAL